MSARRDNSRRLGFDVMRFCDDIEAIAARRSMSQHRLSFETGVHQSTLSLMKNKNRVPDGANLAALCKWSGLDAADYSIDREQEEI